MSAQVIEVRTLNRRLQDEGVTFAKVHDERRHRMARDFLTAREISVNEAAYLLRFSEASSFVRAFKRWTGQSPSTFRGELASFLSGLFWSEFTITQILLAKT